MTSIQPTTSRILSQLRNLSALLLALTLAACGDSLTGPGMEDTPEEPEPELTTVYDLNLTTRYIEVRGSCDAADLFGNPTHGEFQYRYEISGEGEKHTRQSDNYNSRLGKTYNRKAGENINFANRTYTWRTLDRTARIDVKLFGTEWDGVTRDNDMENRSDSKAVPVALGKKTRSVTLGSKSSCQIRLYYDAEWTERLVQN